MTFCEMHKSSGGCKECPNRYVCTDSPLKMKEYNRDHAVWVVKEISKHKGRPHMMANEELADDIFPYIIEKFPEAVMVKLGIEQWIAVNKRGRKELQKRLEARKDSLLKDVSEIESAINLVLHE